MSSPPASSSSAVKWMTGILGVVLLLASLGGFTYTGYLDRDSAWNLWQRTHPHAAPAAPVKTPGGVKGTSLANAAKSAPVHIPVDVLTKTAAYFIGEIIALFLGIRLLQADAKKKTAAVGGEIAVVAAPKAARRAPARRWTTCNVLQIGADTRRLWNFGAGKTGFTLSQNQSVPSGQPLPVNLVGRDWKMLFQPKLNIAWLPVEQVFLRVAQLPVSEFEDTLAMVELQLEKLSPLPVTQIVWSIQVLPHQVDNLQTVIVIIMARDLVEKFLGELEGQGYLADRLELPILDQLQATTTAADGAYLYPDSQTGKFTALVAWWYGGTLRNLGLLHVPAVEGRDALLKEQLTQMAWSGELEGWLEGQPRWHLIADETTAANWQPMFRPWLGQPVEVLPPLTEAQLATVNANRSARADLRSGMLPVEYTTRYHQEFLDRLWMRGLGAVLGIYVLCVMVYLAGAGLQGMRTEKAATDLASLSRSYTNALQLKAKLEILQNRQALKFASLDCWKITAENLPVNVTVQTLEFRDGKHFTLSGVVPDEQRTDVTDFNEALRKATLNDQPLFEKLDPPQMKLMPGANNVSWNFSGDLARAEEVK